jgi:hypothetical protein
MPSYHVVKRQGFIYHILVTQDPLCELSLGGYEVMAIVAVKNLQNYCLLILVSSQQAFTRIVIGHGRQILDCRLGALVSRESRWTLSFPVWNCWTMSEGVMLAINIAAPEIFLLYTGSMTPGEICYKVCQLARTDPCFC